MANQTPEDDRISLDAIVGEPALKHVDYRALGTSGLRGVGGIVNEATIYGLSGLRRVEIFRQMGMDASVGAVLFMQKAMMKGAKWPVVDASQDPKDLEAGDFIRSVFEDMEQPWSNYISEICSFFQFGYSLHEIMFKRRAGRSPEPYLNSKYQDGRIGLRGLPIRSQDTIVKWEFDPSGTIIGATQMDPYAGRQVTIPMSKALLFRAGIYKNNPEGDSFCERVYQSWYYKKSIQQSQAIGVQRDLCGVPKLRLPGRIMNANASMADKAEYAYWKKIGNRLNNDELACVFLPSDRDPETKQYLYDMDLMNSGGSRAHNLSQIIGDLRNEIFDGAMAGMIQLGQGQNSGGSFAMHSDKTELMLMSMTSFMDEICNVINTHLIPMLLDLNGMDVTDYPELTHSPLERRNVLETAQAMQALTHSGAGIFGGPEGEMVTKRMLEWMGMQTAPDQARTNLQRQNLPVTTADTGASIAETHADTPMSQAKMSPEELRAMARPMYRGDVKPNRFSP